MAELKELRKFMNLTQKELAEKTGMNIRQIQKLEKGEIDINNITAKNAQALSSALGCSVEEMLTLDLNIFTDDAETVIERWRIRFEGSPKNGQVSENQKTQQDWKL